MKRLLFAFLFIFSLIPFFADAAWYDSAWQYRIEVQSDSTLVAENEVDFPLYLDLSLLGSDFFSNVKSDGSDIIITSSDELTALDYELVYLDIVNEEGEIHFKADTLNPNSDTSFYVYYGNSGTNSFIPSSVWDSFRGVWHFNEDLNVNNSHQARGVATQAAMDGGDGSWALWYGDNAISNNVRLAVDEDQVSDTERAHTTEQVGYWIFGADTELIKDRNDLIIGEVGSIATIASNISSVNLVNTYTNPVVVATQRYTSGHPAVVRLNNVSSDSFDVFLQNPEPSNPSGNPDDSSIDYIVLEAGSYLLPGNIPLEAGSSLITSFNRSANWDSSEMNQINPINSYSNPIVLGSITTLNNNQWQTFWSSNGNRLNPASSSSIYIGRHTGADNNPTVVNEELSYIIVDQHLSSTNSYFSRARLSSDTIRGVDDNAPFTDLGISSSGNSGYSFFDSSVNAFHASHVGNVQTGLDSQVGRSVRFPGNSTVPIDGLNYTNSNNLDSLTASFWLNTTDTARSGIFDFDRSEHWELGLNFHNESGGNGKISFDTAAGTGGIQDFNSSSRVNDGDWHHVVAVFDKDAMQDKKIYIDGVLNTSVDQHSTGLGTGVTRYGFFADGSEASFFEGSTNNLFYQGYLDEVRLQHYAQDANSILTNYNNQSDNAAFWSVSAQEQLNVNPLKATGLFFAHTNAQSGQENPVNVSVGGTSSYVPYFSALYNGDGDTAVRAYIQVSTDQSFNTIDYWDSDWFDLSNPVSDLSRSENIQYDTSLSGSNAAIQSLSMDDGNVNYYWRIAFEDDSGLQGDFSDPNTFSLLDRSIAPQNISTTKIEGSPDTFIVNWQDISLLEESFEVEYREDTGLGFGSWQTVTLPQPSPAPMNTTSWGMENTVGNAAYNFRVRSCNYSGCSAWVEDVVTHYTDPEAPVEVCSAYQNDVNFEISWKNRAVFNQSSVEQCDGLSNCNSSTFTEIATLAQDTNTVNSVGTVVNQIYRWLVYADNGVVESDPTYSNFEYTSPSAPTGVEAVWVSDNVINLSWTDTSFYEDGFRVYVSVNGSLFEELTPNMNTTNANDESYVYTEAEPGNTYQFDVRAHIGQTTCLSIVNSELLSVSSLSNLIQTQPKAPSVSTIGFVSDNDITVSWIDESDNEDGFRIYVRENNGAWSLAGSVAEDVTNFNYTLGSSNNVYDFYIESFISINLPGNPEELVNTKGPAEFRRVYTTPGEPSIALDYISSTSIDWVINDNADYELGFNFYNSVNNEMVRSVSSPNIDSITETGLIPNTSYERYIRSYVENSGVLLESNNSNVVSFYTLANSPANPIVSENNLGEIELSWENGLNPPGTEFYVENINTGNSSGWIADLFTWVDPHALCGTSYGFILKARNGDFVETGEEFIEYETEACPEKEKKASVRKSQKDLEKIFGKKEELDQDDLEDQKQIDKEEKQCSAFTKFTQNMKIGDKDGSYSLWEKGFITEINLLQSYMNKFNFRSGPVDGILGPITHSAIRRMQKNLGTYQDGMVGPITRSLINTSCL